MVRHFPEPGVFSTRLSGDVRKCPPKMSLAWTVENGADILLVVSSEAISSSMTCGSLSVEGRFARMKVCHRGSGFLIGDP